VIAVVEDDPSMRKAIARIVRGLGLLFQTYASAEAFLGDEARCRFACLILDIQLRGMSGLELMRHLAQQGREVRVVFVTALEGEALQREAEEMGCVAYLRKPFEAGMLIAAIRRACEPAVADEALPAKVMRDTRPAENEGDHLP
jgi:FixJ family two-component response regulator